MKIEVGRHAHGFYYFDDQYGESEIFDTATPFVYGVGVVYKHGEDVCRFVDENYKVSKDAYKSAKPSNVEGYYEVETIEGKKMFRDAAGNLLEKPQSESQPGQE